MDDLILQLRDAVGATVVVVTHELASIFAIADSALFLDVETKTALCDGNPTTYSTTQPPSQRFDAS